MTVEDFKKRIVVEDFDDILNDIILSDDAKHVDKDGQVYIKTKIAEKYNVTVNNIKVIIVGSAKLGFSISEKKMKGGVTLPRYRPFRADSDIDTAIISPAIYEIIWNELSRFSFNQPWIPWDSGKLGDYMVCGWLRPDYFPREKRLRRCDDWWDVFTNLSAQHKFDRRRVRGGLFYNMDQLKSYQGISLSDCIQFEKINQ